MPGDFCFWYAHRTGKEKRLYCVLGWVMSRSMHGKSCLLHLLTNQRKALFLPLSAIGFRTPRDFSTFLGEMLQKAMLVIPQSFPNLGYSYRPFPSLKNGFGQRFTAFRAHASTPP